jgi:hypothetical protein
MSEPLTSKEYELLVQSLVEKLYRVDGVTTERLAHDQVLAGRSGPSQIDVVWDFRDASGSPRRVIFEAKSYGRSITREKLHTLRSVVADLQDPARPVTGVMVTKTGYQSGAKEVATTHGLLVLELREPTAADLTGRILNVTVVIQPQLVLFPRTLRVEAAEVVDETAGGSTAIEDVTIVRAGQPSDAPERLKDILLAGELGTLGEPRPLHEVRRTFDPPAQMLVGGRLVALITALVCEVGEEAAEPIVVTSTRDIAWLIRDAITGARVWVSDDGGYWSTDN